MRSSGPEVSREGRRRWAAKEIAVPIRELDFGGSARLMLLPVDEGRVVCPQRGVVDVGRCLGCASYRGFRDGHRERLVCAADGFAGDGPVRRDR
jgi:hypothetical protein